MSLRLPPRLERMLPPPTLARRLSVQPVLFAFGEGTFLTGIAVFLHPDRRPLRGAAKWALGAAAEAVLYLGFTFGALTGGLALARAI